MSWWDSIIDFGRSAVSAVRPVVDFARENPTLTGAVVGGLAGGGRGALKGAALGYGLGNLMGSQGSFEPPPVTQFFGGQPGGWSNASDGRPNSSGLRLPGQTSTSFDGTGSVGLGQLTAPLRTGLAMDDAGSTNAVSQASITGDFGAMRGASGLTMGPQTASTPMLQGSGLSQITSGMRQVARFGQENPELTRAGVQLAASLATRGDRRRANQLMEQALQQNQQANARNIQVADNANRDAERLSDVAWSNVNPQNMAARSYAQSLMQGERGVERLNALRDRGVAPSVVEAEKRRARLATSRNAVTAWNSGMDTGQQLQTSTLQAAGGLRRNYDAPLSAAQTARTNVADDTANITRLLESYLDRPSAEMERRRVNELGVTQ